MPLWNNFPYTNYHEMNLQFILDKIKKVEDLQQTVNELAGKYNDMYNKVNDLSALYDGFAEEIRAEMTDFETAGVAYINAALFDMENQMNAAFADQNARISAVESRMDVLERTVANAYYMDSPFTGETVPMQQVIYELASLHMTEGLTAAEYDAADLTAAAYDALDLTAYAYDWHGSTYIS